jgi:integrase
LRNHPPAPLDQLELGDDYVDHGLVFATRLGTPLIPRNVIRAFKLALERAGLPQRIRVHDLRHAAATLMLAAGVHPKIASERLGHSNIGITLDLYTHSVRTLDEEAAEQMQQVLRREQHEPSTPVTEDHGATSPTHHGKEDNDEDDER